MGPASTTSADSTVTVPFMRNRTLSPESSSWDGLSPGMERIREPIGHGYHRYVNWARTCNRWESPTPSCFLPGCAASSLATCRISLQRKNLSCSSPYSMTQCNTIGVLEGCEVSKTLPWSCVQPILKRSNFLVGDQCVVGLLWPFSTGESNGILDASLLP